MIPLEELREADVLKKYGLSHDAEVLDILDTVSRTKGVSVLTRDFFSFNNSTYSQTPILFLIIFDLSISDKRSERDV